MRVVVPWCRGAVIGILLTSILPFKHFRIKINIIDISMETFNDEFRRRTKTLALRIVRLYSRLGAKDESKIIGKQLLRSSTSMAANFRASCRARSEAEHYTKLCIVIEESDETLFWLELLEESGLINPGLIKDIKDESFSILQVLSKARKKLKK
jgi:four helix bundle protein